MSQIVSFYTTDKNMSEALLQAAAPQRKIIEKKVWFFTRKIEQTVDNYWDFIKEQATQQESYGYSGTGFTDLELLLEEKGVNLYQFGSDEFARKLSAARPSVLAVFDQLSAQNTLKMLHEITITRDEAQTYYKENFPLEDDALAAEALMSALDIYERWLAAVAESRVGILEIG